MEQRLKKKKYRQSVVNSQYIPRCLTILFKLGLNQVLKSDNPLPLSSAILCYSLNVNVPPALIKLPQSQQPR